MIYFTKDEENRLCDTIETLRAKGFLRPATTFFGGVQKYMEKEWGYKEPPTMNEIKSTAESFFKNNENIKYIKSILNNDDNFNLFFDFMLTGIDAIFQERKQV